MHRLQKRGFGALSAGLATLVIAFALAGMVPGSALAQEGFDIVGNWSLSWQGARDTYAGRLDVLRRIGPNRYYGKVTLLPSRGQMVTQEARIVVNGPQVDIECYNPSRRPYNPDRFFVTWRGSTMQGYSVDTAGQRGSQITFTRL